MEETKREMGMEGVGMELSLTSGEGILRRGFSDLRVKYEMGPELGKGGKGTVVYECTERTSGKKYACKSIPKAELKDWKAAEALKTEVEVMRLLSDHPHIVTFKDMVEDVQDVHLIMELCEGGNLLGHINETKFIPEQQAAMICRSLVEVARYCHGHGVIHRDLKPENILLVRKGAWWDLRVADFGISTFFKTGENIKGYAGSLYYVAPEILKGSHSKEADIWSLGIILYTLLSKTLPFYDVTAIEVYRKILEGKLDLCRGPWKKISSLAKGVIQRMLSSEPSSRITAEEILQHPWILSNQCDLSKMFSTPDKPTRRTRSIVLSLVKVISAFRHPSASTPPTSAQVTMRVL